MNVILGIFSNLSILNFQLFLTLQTVKIYSRNDIIELLPTTNGDLDVFINENTKVTNITSGYEFGGSKTAHPLFR